MTSNKFYPLITIYITNYNYGKYIKQSINSVLNQSYKNFELIIIDDGSTDNSRKIIDNYKNNKKIKIVYQKNKGLNKSNNVALKLSKGDYISRVDADDWIDENFLQIMINNLKKDPKIGMIFCNYFITDKKGKIKDQFFRHDFRKVKLLDQPAHGACSLINTKCLKSLGGYNEKFKSQDGVDIWIRLIQKYRIKNINLPLFYYRQHDENLSKNKLRLFKSRDKIFDNYQNKKKKYTNTICIIPIRGGSENSIALKKIFSKTVLERLIDQLKLSNKIKKVIVSSPDENILKFVNKKYKNNVLILKRDFDLSQFNVPISKTLISISKTLEKKIKFDSILKVNVDHPLLSLQNFESAINILNLFEPDEVIAVKKENESFYQHNGKGLVPIQKSKNLIMEDQEIYKKIGSLHLFTKKCLYNYLKSKDKITGHLILDNIKAFRVENKIDFEIFKLLQKINDD